MADFSTPFGINAEKRFPSSTEKLNGHACGAASLALFNGLQYRLEAEVGNVIAHAGITQTDDRMTLLREAIVALIAAATGSNPAGYILMDQARARLPIFPEVLNADGRIVVTSPAAGTIRLPGGIEFLHRGIFTVTTAQTDYPTVASRTYHLRWDKTNGFRMRDLTDTASYNPLAAPETDARFDSTHDDMLIARVITNSSNVATITNLANKHDLRAVGEEVSAKGTLVDFAREDNTRPSAITQYRAVSINFARRPDVYLTAANDLNVRESAFPLLDELNFGAKPLSRYQVAVWGQGDVDIWTGWAARA